MNAKIKKRQLNNMGGLQQSCNTNPNRGNTNNTQQETLGSQAMFTNNKDKDREGSVDGTSQYNINKPYAGGNQPREAYQSKKDRDLSAGKDGATYLTAQVYQNNDRGNSKGAVSIGVTEYNNADASSLNG